MDRQKLIETINKNVSLNAAAWGNLYHGKTYVVASIHIETFYKTKRGAEGYIKRQKNISYYDEMTFSMVNCGDGLQVFEIRENELKDFKTDCYVWYWELKNTWSKGWYYDDVLHMLDQYNVTENVKKFVTDLIEQLKNESGFPIIDEYEIIDNEQENSITDNKENPDNKNAIKENKKDHKEITVTADKENHEKKDKEINITYKLNEEKNGVEIYFSDKPDQKILESLKANGFRWSRYKKCWYAKQNENTISLAKNLASGKVNKDNVTYPEIEIDDIKNYTIPQELIRRENNSNWIFRTKEIDWEKELHATLKRYQDQVVDLLQKTDNEQIIYMLKKSLQRFKKKYYQNMIKRLENRANNPHWAVTGRAGRNMRKYQKANDRYDDLLGEAVRLQKDIEKRINQYANMIKEEKRKQEEREIKKAIENNTLQLEFQTKTKEFEFMGMKEKKRVYQCDQYWTCRLWGCYRIFKDDKEIHSLKSYEKLSDAKKYILFLIAKDREKEQKVS